MVTLAKALTDAIASQKGAQKSYSTPYYLPEVEDESDEKVVEWLT